MAESKIKILLIHPPAATGLKIKESLKYPPMGIAFLAAVAREAGYPVRVFDANVEEHPFEKAKEILASFKPNIVGISFTSLLAASAHDTAKLVKDADPRIIVVGGGYHPTVMPLEVIEDNNFNFLVVGEGERTFIELFQNIEAGGENISQVKGLVFRSGDKIIQTEKRELLAEIDSLPFPAYDLLPINFYSSLASTRKPYVTFIRSRGCPFNCIFCGVHRIFSRCYRCQSPGKTISEIDILVKKFGVREINFRDSDFLINRQNVEKLCELLIVKNYDLIWTCNARVDMVDEKILKLMKKAGCRIVTYGAESGNQEILDNLKKGITLSQTREAVRLAKSAGIKCALDMILGGIGETEESFRQTLKFLNELDPDYASFSYLTAYPGSELYEEALRRHWFLKPQAANNDYEELNLNATKMSDAELLRTYKRAATSFYFRPHYLIKRLMNLNWAEWKNNFKGIWTIIRNFK